MEFKFLQTGAFGYVVLNVTTNKVNKFPKEDKFKSDLEIEYKNYNYIREKCTPNYNSDKLIVELKMIQGQDPRTLKITTCLEMDYMACGDLLTVLSSIDKFSYHECKFYMASIGLALSYLHSGGVVYGDLKLENVLISSRGVIRICDFGFCVKQGRRDYFFGTPLYAAPETAALNNYTFASDWWALGVVGYMISLNNPPFTICDYDKEVISNHRLNDRHKKKLSKLDIFLKILIEDLLKVNLHERLASFESFQEQPIFLGFKWEKCNDYGPHSIEVLNKMTKIKF